MLHEMLDQEVSLELLARNAQFISGEIVRELISDRDVGTDGIEWSKSQWKPLERRPDRSEKR